MNNMITICNKPIVDFTIICPRDTDEKLMHHIKTFSEYLGIKSILTEDKSADFELVISETNRENALANKALSDVKYDGFVFSVESGRMNICANNDAGIVNGLYAFLETIMGYRFYAPDCTRIIPVGKKNYEEGYVYSFTPAFEYRDIYWYAAMYDEEWSYRLHLNSAVGRHYYNQVGAVSYAGASFVHTLANLTNEPPVIDKQPCLTDENVFNTVMDNVRRYLKEKPDAKIISVSQNDSYPEGRGCQCENCRAIDEREGTPMGSLLTFVNRVADEIRDEYPNVYVDTLAYRYTRKAPKTIKPHDNVVIRLCSIECCFAHPMDEKDCELNVAFCNDIEAWSKISKKLYVWDYTTNFLFYMAPFSNFKVLWNNVKFLREHNVCGLFEQGNYQSESCDLGYLRTYLISRLLYNPNISEKEYYDEMDAFLSAYYGSGSKYIREYIDLLCDEAKECHMTIYDQITKHFSSEKMTKLYELWNKALEEAKTEEEKAHIEKDMIALDYCDLYLNFDNRHSKYQDMYNKMKKHSITHFRESSPYPEITNFESANSVIG